LTPKPPQSRIDLVRVAEMVEPRTRVLDVGCGDGTLLRLLAERREVDGRGIEISQRGVNDCVAKGLSVIQGDADTDLADYPDDAFDYVILSQTLQATRQPRVVMEHMLRIGRRAIVSFPNFGHWRIRAHAGDRESEPLLVRHAEHPFLHDSRFRHSDAADRRTHRDQHCAR
jgi:methionine biosynthesis protein MetW